MYLNQCGVTDTEKVMEDLTVALETETVLSPNEIILDNSLMPQTESNCQDNTFKKLKKEIPFKECPLCHKKRKYLPSHLETHGLDREEIKQIMHENRVRKIPKGRKGRKCPFPKCANCPAFPRLDKHLQSYHKLSKEHPKYRKFINTYTVHKKINSDPQLIKNMQKNEDRVEASEKKDVSTNAGIDKAVEASDNNKIDKAGELSTVTEAGKPFTNAPLVNEIVKDFFDFLTGFNGGRMTEQNALQYKCKITQIIIGSKIENIEEFKSSDICGRLSMWFQNYIETHEESSAKFYVSVLIKFLRYLGIKNPTFQIHYGTIITCAQNWSKSFRTTIIRKIVTTRVHSTGDNEAKEEMANHFKHRPSTAVKWYKDITQCTQAINAGHKVYKTMYGKDICFSKDDKTMHESSIVEFPSECFNMRVNQESGILELASHYAYNIREENNKISTHESEIPLKKTLNLQNVTSQLSSKSVEESCDNAINIDSVDQYEPQIISFKPLLDSNTSELVEFDSITKVLPPNGIEENCFNSGTTDGVEQHKSQSNFFRKPLHDSNISEVIEFDSVTNLLQPKCVEFSCVDEINNDSDDYSKPQNELAMKMGEFGVGKGNDCEDQHELQTESTKSCKSTPKENRSRGRAYFTKKERELIKIVFRKYILIPSVPSMNIIRNALERDIRLKVLKKARKDDAQKIRGCVQNFYNIEKKKVK